MITVTLTTVTDAAGHNLSNFSVSMRVLTGDTNANRRVNASDVAQTKSQSGHALSAANFREDANADGSLSASDVSLVKSFSGTSVP
jgi:hypothetical protein